MRDFTKTPHGERFIPMRSPYYEAHSIHVCEHCRQNTPVISLGVTNADFYFEGQKFELAGDKIIVLLDIYDLPSRFVDYFAPFDFFGKLTDEKYYACRCVHCNSIIDSSELFRSTFKPSLGKNVKFRRIDQIHGDYIIQCDFMSLIVDPNYIYLPIPAELRKLFFTKEVKREMP